jgi:hypothetical protein
MRLSRLLAEVPVLVLLPTTPCMPDDVLATNGSGKGKGGYNFGAATSGANNTLYVATADPVTVGSTGQRSFCSVEDAVIRFDSSGTKPADHGACQALGALN